MTRRPMRPPMAAADGARRRMAPGGRMWSESPVVYPRERVAGAGTVTIPDVTYVAFANLNTTTGDLTWNAARQAGDLMVALVAANGGTVSAPAGWTTHASGSAGSAAWILASGVSVGGATGTVEGTFGLPGTGGVAGVPYCVRGGTVGAVDAQNTGTGTSHGFIQPVGGVAFPIQTIIAQDQSGGSVTGEYVTPTEYWNLASTQKHPGGLCVVSTYGEGVGDPDGPFPTPTTLLTPNNTCDYAAITWGVL
jgi:hypothetical protein